MIARAVAQRIAAPARAKPARETSLLDFILVTGALLGWSHQRRAGDAARLAVLTAMLLAYETEDLGFSFLGHHRDVQIVKVYDLATRHAQTST